MSSSRSQGVMSPLWCREFYGISYILQNLCNPVLNSVTQYRVWLWSTNHFYTTYCTLRVFMWTSGSTKVTVRSPLSSAGRSPWVTVVMLQAAHRLTFYRHLRSLEAHHNLHMAATLYPFQSQMSHSTRRQALPFFYTTLILYHFRPCLLCCLNRFSDQNFERLSLIFPACYMSNLLYNPYLVALLIYATESNLQLIFLFPC